MVIYYFLICILFISFLYAVGSLISTIFFSHRFFPNPYELVLRNIFLGYIFIIIAQSLISTGCKTVNLIFLLIIIFVFIEIRRVKSVIKNEKIKLDRNVFLSLF